MNLDGIIKATNRIVKVSDKLDAVKALFKIEPDYVDSSKAKVTNVHIETLIDIPLVTILLASYKKPGEALPLHAHKDSLEYLISLKGKHLLKLPENHIRIIEQGDCATIPSGIDHTTVSMSDDAELLAICIPPELAYRKVENGDY